MYLGSDNYLGSTAYLGPGPNGTPEPTGDETLIEWRDIVLHGRVGRFTIADLAGWDDLPDARTQWDPRPNQHGMFDAPVYASERHVMVAGNCFNKEQRDLLIRELKSGMTYGPHAEMLTITHAGLRLSVAARLVRFNATYINWDEGAYGWQAEWVAPDPFRYGSQRMLYTGLPELKGGLNFPLFTDGTGNSGEAATYAWTGTPGESTSTKSQGGSVVAHNYNPAGAFRYGLGVYSAWSNAESVELDTEAYWSGSQSVHVVGSHGTNRPQSSATIITDAGTYPGATIRAQAWIRTEPGASSTEAGIRLGGTGVETASATVLTEGEWQLVTCDATVNASGTIVMYLYGAAGVGISSWIDSVRLGEPDGHGIFDGDTPDVVPEWGGGGWLDFGEAGSSGRITLRNDGDAEAFPRFQVRGPAPEGFTIANTETGRRIVSRTVVPAGSVLTIHTAKGTAYLDGADRSGQLTVREWTAVPPDESYTFQFTAPTYTGASLVASIRNTYS